MEGKQRNILFTVTREISGYDETKNALRFHAEIKVQLVEGAEKTDLEIHHLYGDSADEIEGKIQDLKGVYEKFLESTTGEFIKKLKQPEQWKLSK